MCSSGLYHKLFLCCLLFRLDTGGGGGGGGPRSDAGGEVVAWKFAELDRDGDGSLRSAELLDLRYMASKLVPPRPCATTFHLYCDPDLDLAIVLHEWTACMRTRPPLNSTHPGTAGRAP